MAPTVLHVSKPAGWADYLAEAMRRAGTTQAQLARESGVPDAVISRWLAGESQPSVPNLRRLATPLRAPLLELLVAAGHLDPAEAQMRDRPVPPEPVRRGVSTDGLDPDQERQLEAFAEFLRARNPDARR